MKSIEKCRSVDILKYKFTMEFISGKGKLVFKINVVYFWSVENFISCKDIFGKINNLRNYLESGDVAHLYW